MEFFDKLGKKASQTYKMGAEKTGKIAKETKLRMLMSDNKGKINDIYCSIGRKFYEKHVEDAINYSEIQEECKKIDELSKEIENARKEILSLKDRKQCPECFTEIEKEYKFCPECGKEQEMSKEGEIIENTDEEKEELNVEIIEDKKEENKEE